jgi:hypothetical protein
MESCIPKHCDRFDRDPLQATGSYRSATNGGGMLITPIMPRLQFFQWQNVCESNRGEKIPRGKRPAWRGRS